MFKKNMSKIDRTVRVIWGAFFIILAVAGVLTGVFAIVLPLVGVVLITTAVAGTCPIYTALGVNTKKLEK